MNIYRVTREYRNGTRTTWHDSKMSADRIVKRHKRIGKKFMKELDKLSDKYPPHKREMHGYLAEVYLKEQEDLINRFNIKMPQQISLDEILYTLNFDKKVRNNNINFILLNNIGNAYIEKNIDNKLIIESVKYIK